MLHTCTHLKVDLLRRLHHPNIVGYKDSFLTPRKGHLCIVMEYCDGGDLSTHIKNARYDRSEQCHFVGRHSQCHFVGRYSTARINQSSKLIYCLALLRPSGTSVVTNQRESASRKTFQLPVSQAIRV